MNHRGSNNSVSMGQLLRQYALVENFHVSKVSGVANKMLLSKMWFSQCIFGLIDC